MAFCIRRKESVKKAIRRLGRKSNEEILECLHSRNVEESIHGARKGLKKARAVLKLIRPSLSNKEYHRQTRTLRAAAEKLAAFRDAHVVDQTLEKLHKKADGCFPAKIWRTGKRDFHRELEAEQRRFHQRRSDRAIERILKQAEKGWCNLSLRQKGWAAVGGGIKLAYQRARLAGETAQSDPSPENLHEWRKRTKDLWYMIELLRPAWPDELRAMTGELEKLSDYLGDDHDLFMLEQRFSKHDGINKMPEWKIFEGLLERKHRELRTPALELGARFYAASASEFCHRLRGYWRVWRHSHKRAAS